MAAGVANLAASGIQTLDGLTVTGQPVAWILRHNKLASIDLAELPSKPRYLDLSHNRIVLLNGLHSLTGLRCFDAGDNYLTDRCLEELAAAAVALQQLGLANNAITRFHVPAGFPMLRMLDLQRNQLKTMVRLCMDALIPLPHSNDDVQPMIENLPRLQVLILDGNKLSAEAHDGFRGTNLTHLRLRDCGLAAVSGHPHSSFICGPGSNVAQCR
jgi:Leucine-rich repeat (LRR) protein